MDVFFAVTSGKCIINPPVGTFINDGDEIVLLRPTGFKAGDYQPLEQPVQLPHSAFHLAAT